MDFTNYLARFGNLDPDTARAASRYYKRQADQLARLASDLEMIERLNGRTADRAIAACNRSPRLRARRDVLERNRAMIQHAERGWTNAEIGRKFDLSPDYVRKIVKAAFSAKNGPLTP